MLNNSLLDKDFLALLDSKRERETYARIIALSYEEEPLEQIEGRITQGTLNIDGSSAVRRTCSLTMVAQELNINDFYWGLKSKFKLEVGVRNTLKDTVCDEKTGETWGDRYPQDIIWFPQGIFVITTFNTSQNATSFTISISGKDKMCFLNGDLGGSLIASIDFGTEEYYDSETNITTYSKVPIETIIREMVHTYGLEPYHNIIINDLDEIAVELLEYRGDKPLYLLYKVQASIFTNFTLNGSMKCRDANGLEYQLDNEITNKLIYDPRVNLSHETGIEPTEVYFEDDASKEYYTIARIEYGQTVGYRLTDLTYAGDLISNVGESITSILDKIKKMLGEYEYFYDIDGRFVFQRKKIYIQSSWNSKVKTDDNDVYVENSASASAVAYSFKDNILITAFSNTPNLSNLKNDYSVWGERTGVSGIKIPVHYRYAIDIKPEVYNSIVNPNDSNSQSITYSSEKCDWRELIYQMAKDHHAYSQYDWYVEKLIEANPITCMNGTTGYEQYYIDLLGFWRELYNENHEWNEQVSAAPDQLNFWFDFLDANSELGQFSTKAVGDRVKAVNDSAVTAIYFREVPDLIFITEKEYQNSVLADKSGYVPVYITGSLENMFNISSQGKSAQNLIDELIYNHSYCIENITIQSVPIYHLQPNVRISVNDQATKVSGDYIVNKLTIPLTYNGTMSISANKVPVRIY